MTKKKPSPLPAEALARLREQAEQDRKLFVNKPSPSELLTPEELADAAPFYFVLRNFIRQLKEARLGAGLTLADVAQRIGMAVESLSRLETGAQTNPTWRTLGLYAAAVGRRPELVALSDTSANVNDRNTEGEVAPNRATNDAESSFRQ